MSGGKIIGRPFQPGQPRPPNGGRKKGTPNKARTFFEHHQSRRARRWAAVDKLYETNPKEALRIEAQMLRDEVELARLEENATQRTGGGVSEAQVLKAARAQGPITDEEAMRCYSRMVLGDTDEARVIGERARLTERQQLPELLRDCRALRTALVSGEYRVRAEVSAADLMRALKPSSAGSLREPPPGSTMLEPDPQPYAGIPLPDGNRLIPALPRPLREREPYPDPPTMPVPIDAEPIRAPTRGYDADPWSDDSVTPVFGPGFVRR